MHYKEIDGQLQGFRDCSYLEEYEDIDDHRLLRDVEDLPTVTMLQKQIRVSYPQTKFVK